MPLLFLCKEYRFYPLEQFKSLVDDFDQYIFITQLYEIGEPLHHPDILACINYAHSKGLGTVISTSLSLKKSDSFWNDLVTSGLDNFIVAIDGTTKTTYNKYRTHGNLILVMDNLRKILQFKKQKCSSLFIEWQMIDFPWNRCEQDSARKLAITLGCNDFLIIEDAHPLREEAIEKQNVRNNNCIWPYVLLLVNVYNDVIPCFKPAYCSGILGNLSKATFSEIWNGEEIRQIRSRILIKSRHGCRICSE
jgi:MoaA/NifB/PqqE/SkfB family radical SAM enzyme